jgi:hypothetical protein
VNLVPLVFLKYWILLPEIFCLLCLKKSTVHYQEVNSALKEVNSAL